ncbi:MAG: flagellar biosynthetic protein FliR [Gammaproteobacteria bacterium]|nr:flagellar biosynthetic protein FliR [Gammaproteobacteria bacterium]
MTINLQQINEIITSAYWPFVRISAMLMVAPIYAASSFPVRIRVVLAVLVTVALYPVIEPVKGVDPISLQGLLILGQQVIIGAAMGFFLQMAFQLLVIAGEAIAMAMGLGFARMMDPQNGVQVPVVAQYFIIIATLLFLSMNGHLLLLQMVIQSFEILPVAETGMTRDGIWQVVAWGSQMFVGAILVAIPAVTALLMSNIAMGVITRAAPQLNIFAVGFPLMLLLGFILLMLTLPSMLPQFSNQIMHAFDAAHQAISAGAK